MFVFYLNFEIVKLVPKIPHYRIFGEGNLELVHYVMYMYIIAVNAMQSFVSGALMAKCMGSEYYAEFLMESAMFDNN